MSWRPSLLVLAIVALAVTGGLSWLSWQGAEAERSPARTDSAVEADPSAPPRPAEAALPAIVREAADPSAVRPAPVAAPALAQGWRGLVLDERNQPLAGVGVYLLDSAANQPLVLPLIVQQRLPLGPLATTATAADGSFAIGLPLAQDKTYELFFLADAHATTRLAGMRLLADQWYDLGAVTMLPGATVRGRVTIEGRGSPLPTAMVHVEASTTFVDAALRALPSGDRGLVANVDATGCYVLRHVPALGLVRISAVAPGFARVVRSDLKLSTAGPLELDFALPPGMAVRGQLRDGRNQPISQARIEAWPKQAAAPPLTAESDRDGRFEVQNLAPGTYRLRIIARGFQHHELAEVEAGGNELAITLARRGGVSVRALSPNREVVRSYQLSLRRCFPERGNQLGYVSEVPEQRVRLDPPADTAKIDGIPPGTFVCQVAAEGYATTLSPTFAIGAADGETQDPIVDVILSLGATLQGMVLDEGGRPIADATVTTQAEGAALDNPLGKLLAGASPDRITVRTTRTNADGEFLLPMLSFGAYQLEVRHESACLTHVTGIQLDVPGTRTLAPVRMQRGALVAGRATVGGRIAGQVKVVLTAAEGTAARTFDGLRLETVTDAEGYFQLPRRVPPGMYALRAAVVDSTEPEAQYFRQLQQLNRSSTPLSVATGQDRVVRDIDLPTDH